MSHSYIILFCSIAAKAFGCINIYAKAEKYRGKWWVNVAYKCFILLILLVAMQLQSQVQIQILHEGSKIVMGKIIAEANLFWITLYVSFTMTVYFNKEIDAWILKCSTMQVKKKDLERNLKFSVAFGALFSILNLGYYALGSLQSDKMYVQAMASVGYFINRITVFFINQMFTTGLRVLTCLFENVNMSLKKLEERAKGPLIYPNYRLRLDFQSLRNRWYELAHLSEQLSTIFSAHTWLFTTLNLLEIIYSCNQLVSIHAFCDRNQYCKMVSFITIALWLLVYLLPDLNMIEACSQIAYQSKQTAHFVTNLEMATDSKALIRDIKTFSYELYVTKVEVSAGGCFVVNSSLMSKKCGTFATFLIILSEFEIDGDHTYYNGFSR